MSRNTKQREVILAVVQDMHSHPTVDEVYAAVRQKLPHVSLATVYRNLELLAEQGLLRKIDFGGSQMRFDNTVHEHLHIRCVQCGRVDDIAIEPGGEVEYHIEHSGGYRVLGHHLEFFGICPVCVREQLKEQQSKARQAPATKA